MTLRRKRQTAMVQQCCAEVTRALPILLRKSSRKEAAGGSGSRGSAGVHAFLGMLRRVAEAGLGLGSSAG